MNRGHRGLHGHGRLHQGLHDGILRHRRHGDNPDDPHVPALVLNTKKNTGSRRPVAAPQIR